MTPSVNQGRDGSWRWEIIDDDGETYLRSDKCFIDFDTAQRDIEYASHLIRPHLFTQ